MKSLIPYLILLTILFSENLYGQSAGRLYRIGVNFLESEQYEDAINQFTRVIEMNPKHSDAYIQRAVAHEKVGNIEMAIEDYNRSLLFIKPKKQAPALYDAGRLSFRIGQFEKANEFFDKVIELDKKHFAAVHLKVRTLIALEQYTNALKTNNEAISLAPNNSVNYFYQGLIYEHLSQLVNAENNYSRAVTINRNYIDAFNALANVKFLLEKHKEAIENCNRVINLDPNNRTAHITRSRVYAKTMDYPSAINDASRILVLNPDDEEVYFIRGTYYHDFKQHSNAINDFTKVISLNKDNAEAYFYRANSYEEILNYKAAVNDYETLATLSEYDPRARKLLDNANQRLFELNREEDPPQIVILDPVPNVNYLLNVPLNKTEVVIKGQIKDESEIKYLKINETNIPFLLEGDVAVFSAKVSLEEGESINFRSEDVYNNITNLDYTINRTEIDPPLVRLLAPYADDNLEIFLSSNDSRLYVEGRIEDQSLISSVFIEDATASFKIDEINPIFSATIDILNKNRITVRATDVHGNETVAVFALNRESLAFAEDSPMGKTWVVFIENSDYQNFASLDGPVSDVTQMKGALANYKIHNIIHKKNMTKDEMEKFFSIELRDLVRSNQVNSIMIWYAGHGKFINDIGYWIPVNARRDDEFTYFNINGLRASLQGYPRQLTHTLIVTDACESGPTFYQAMRASDDVKSCDDWSATRFKSSQVVSSAGYESAADNSQFTRTFANSLLNNSNACLPIETIVRQVTVAVSQTGSQRPRFGKIAGLEDEGGTFFFIAKD